MRSSFDLRHNTAQLVPESLNDLWLLSKIISPGDLVRARTYRTIEIRRAERKEKVGKRAVVLTIEVQKIELNQRLRLSGKIVQAPEEIPRGWHTIEIKPGSQLKLTKAWKTWEIKKIRAAALKPIPVLVCILDEREADVWRINEKINHLAHICAPPAAREKGAPSKAEYFGQIVSVLARNETGYTMIAGPGFEKENLTNYIKERAALKSKLFTDSLAHTGEPGLNELFKRKSLERALSQSKLTAEVSAVEEFFEALAKGRPVAYGPEAVQKALELGAVARLLISEDKIRDYEQAIELAEKTKAKIIFISTQHSAGQRLSAMGGIAALLRFKLQE